MKTQGGEERVVRKKWWGQIEQIKQLNIKAYIWNKIKYTQNSFLSYPLGPLKKENTICSFKQKKKHQEATKSKCVI